MPINFRVLMSLVNREMLLEFSATKSEDTSNRSFPEITFLNCSLKLLWVWSFFLGSIFGPNRRPYYRRYRLDMLAFRPVIVVLMTPLTNKNYSTKKTPRDEDKISKLLYWNTPIL